MRNRILLLIFLLLIRCTLGWLSTLKFETGRLISIKGYPDKLYLKDTNCIIKISNFIFSSKSFCAQYENKELKVIGTLNRQVIDSLNGNLWLSDAKIDILGEKHNEDSFLTGIRNLIDNFRNNLVNIFKKSVPEPEAGLTAGVVLGYKDDIGQDFYEALVRSGTIHIAVASGYNILLVGGTFMSLLFWFLKRSRATMAAMFVMFAYVVLAGGEPPVVRAFIMAMMMYIAMVTGRSSVSWWSLALTSCMMMLFDPTLIISASFQLSIGASFGLMVISPWMSKIIKDVKVLSFMETTGIITTLSTMIVTLPILWWYFGRMSLIGIVSNILILPLVPVMMMLGAGTLVAPGIFAIPLYAIAHLAVRIVWFLGS